jgi:hypothetical protein
LTVYRKVRVVYATFSCVSYRRDYNSSDDMATIDTPPPDYPLEITGYAEPWIASPGETVAIKVSDIRVALKA